MDTRYGYITWNGLRSELLYFTKSPNTFITDLCDNQLGSFGWADFFTQKSDWVTSLTFLPVNVSLFGTLGVDYIVLGNQTLSDYTGFYSFGGLTSYSRIKLFELTISKIHNNFLDYAPYTKRYLYVPYFERIELDLEMVTGHTITAWVSLDAFSGNLALYIENDNGVLLYQQTAKIGIEISIGKSNEEEIRRNNILHSVSLLGSAATLAVGAETGNAVSTSGGISLATKTLTQALANNVKRLSSYKGGNGNRTELVCDKTIRMITETVQNVAYPQKAIKGKVCKQNLSLSGVTGYTEIGEINFNPSGAEITDDEISEIIDLLHSGVIL